MTVPALLGTGLGLLVMIIGWRGGPTSDGPRRGPDRPQRDPRWAIRAGLAAAVAVLVGASTGWPVGGVLAGLGWWCLPRLLGRDPAHAHRVARIEAIATWTEMLRDTLSAAAGLERAILTTATLAPPAIRGELTELATRLQHGERLAPTLRALADRLADPVGDLVIAALVMAADQQARQLGDLLGSLAHAAREQASMRLRVEAGQARTRTSVRVIVATTLAFVVAILVLNREYLSAYDTATGQGVLAGVGALFATGLTWLARIATVAEPPRFLTAPTAGRR